MLEAELRLPVAELNPAELMLERIDEPDVSAVGVTSESPRGGRGSDSALWNAVWLLELPGRAVRSLGSCTEVVFVLTERLGAPYDRLRVAIGVAINWVRPCELLGGAG